VVGCCRSPAQRTQVDEFPQSIVCLMSENTLSRAFVSEGVFSFHNAPARSQVVGDRKPKEFRLNPRKTRGRQARSPRTWCSTYLLILRYARELRAQQRKPQARRTVPTRPYNQRRAARVMYAKNATRRGQGRHTDATSPARARAKAVQLRPGLTQPIAESISPLVWTSGNTSAMNACGRLSRRRSSETRSTSFS
jgi:hypothetical protein